MFFTAKDIATFQAASKSPDRAVRADALNDLGVLYAGGATDVDRDPVAALDCFDRAIEEGSEQARFNAGLLCSSLYVAEGFGFSQNEKNPYACRAVKYLVPLVEEDGPHTARAAYALGLIYQRKAEMLSQLSVTDSGSERIPSFETHDVNLCLARHYYGIAVDRGLKKQGTARRHETIDAGNRYALCLATGAGGDVDGQRAVDVLRATDEALGGNTKTRFLLARLYLGDMNVPQDLEEAEKWAFEGAMLAWNSGGGDLINWGGDSEDITQVEPVSDVIFGNKLQGYIQEMKTGKGDSAQELQAVSPQALLLSPTSSIADIRLEKGSAAPCPSSTRVCSRPKRMGRFFGLTAT